MAEQLVIYCDGAERYRFDKRDGLARMQFAYVQRLDADMDRGIELDGERVLCPDLPQRTRFVIGQLLHAVNSNDSRTLGLLCRWLAQHVPALDAIRIADSGDEVDVELGYDDGGTH